ncbi:MAG: hypothetical protein ACPLW7_02105, partial [Minisyncoccia bacterium]
FVKFGTKVSFWGTKMHFSPNILQLSLPNKKWTDFSVLIDKFYKINIWISLNYLNKTISSGLTGCIEVIYAQSPNQPS